MERKTNLKQVKNCSEDPPILKIKTVSAHWMYQKYLYGSFVNVDVINALFEFLFVLRYSKLDFCLCKTFIYNKKWSWFSTLQVLILTVVFSPSKQLLKIKLHDFLINSRHSHDKYCFHNCTLWGKTITVDPRIKFGLG